VNLRIHDVMSRQVLNDHKLGCLPVAEHGAVVGIITETGPLRYIFRFGEAGSAKVVVSNP
jgi:hypothetical protein